MPDVFREMQTHFGQYTSYVNDVERGCNTGDAATVTGGTPSLAAPTAFMTIDEDGFPRLVSKKELTDELPVLKSLIREYVRLTFGTPRTTLVAQNSSIVQL